jgi:Ca2+/Na+ antiporter
MTWYKLEDDQVDGLINIGLMLILAAAAVSFYLDNPIWQYSMLGIIIVFSVYIDFLYNKQKRKHIKNELWKEFQKEAERIRKL